MSAYHGRKGVVYMSTSGTGTATSVSNLKTWSINMPTDKVEVTAFGDGELGSEPQDVEIGRRRLAVRALAEAVTARERLVE